MARKKFSRTTRRFQLRLGSEYPQDNKVLEVLDTAKKEKREVEMIRDAVELFDALEQGNLDALFAKFPQYRTVMNNGVGDSGLDEDKLADRIAQKILSAGNNGYTMQSAQPPAGLKPLAAASQQFALPTFDDDELPALSVKRNTNSDSGLMFLAAMQGVGA